MSFQGFTFRNSNPTTTTAGATGGSTFGGFNLSTTAAGPGGDSKLPTKPATGFFGTPTATAGVTNTAAPTLNFNFAGTPASTKAATSVPSAAPQLTFGASPNVSSTLFTPIGSSTVTTTTVAATAIGTTPATTTATVAPKLSFGIPSTATTTTAPVASVASTTTAGITPITSIASAIPAAGSLTFAQLEDSINKWTIDLEEQSKFFINQAKQLNAWDSLLISNGEKILNLNSSIERVKQQQQQLDQELDFILAQQRELEELIVPLEKDLNDLPVTDIDRNQMYQFSEIIDSQLKQMSDDLKEIIEHINESNKDDEVASPVTQISRILNAHMNSLQWIDRNTAQITGHLEQITKLQDTNRRNFALNNSFNNSLNM